MTSWRASARLVGIRVDRNQAIAMDYLESVGQRFLIDFGYLNALEKATSHWIAYLERSL